MKNLADIRQIVLYGLSLAILVLSLKVLQWKYLIVNNAMDIYIGIVAVFFTLLGVWVATKLLKPEIKTVVVEKEVVVTQPDEFTLCETALKKLNLSNREYEVLQLLAKGHRNAEIAEELYISVSTVKTHVSKLLEKLDVKSRTQAVTKAQNLRVV
jgi:DNA-binding CsgD family transcriptional regulator